MSKDTSNPLEMTDFKLSADLSFRIQKEDLEELEKDEIKTKELNDEQREILKTALKKIGPKKPLTREEIIALIDEVRKIPKTKRYRQSGHLVDQKLKFQTPKQMTIFDALMPETKQKIEESRFEVRAEGIRLSYAENKLIHALNLLLFEKSQNSDPNSDSFYSGNVPSEIVPYGVPDGKSQAPVLKFRPSELYKAFTSTNSYSGADIKFIIDTLYQLESKKVLIKYDRVKKVKQGNKITELTDRIEDFQSLIKIMSFISDLTNEEKENIDEKQSSVREERGEIIIALNPIFRDQIDTKYIEFPEDMQKRLVIAAGGHKKVTASMQILMEYMLREISANRFTPQINEDKLPYILGLEKYITQNRKKLLKERIDKDIQAVFNLGIILKIENLPNKDGKMKWVFHLNKDYE